MKKLFKQGKTIDCIRLPEAKAQPFRMPLNAPNGQSGMAHGFDNMIRRGLQYFHAWRGVKNCLMVAAVDRTDGTVQFFEKTSFPVFCFMQDIFLGVIMQVTGYQVLNQCAAKVDLYQLEAFADAEHRFFLLDKII